MLKIRLSRVGKNNCPIYRLVVTEKSRAVKRENIEVLGLYNPTNKSDKFQFNKDRILFWMSRGAQLSDTVNNLLCDFSVLPKNKKVNIVYKKAKKKDDQKDQTKETGEKLVENKEVKVDESKVKETEAENIVPKSEEAKNPEQKAEIETEQAVVEESEESKENKKIEK